MGVSFNILYLSLALLIGLYAGININVSSHGHIPTVVDVASSSSSKLESERQMKEELKQYQAEVEQWKSKVKKMEKDYVSSMNKVQELEGTCSKRNNVPPTSNPHPICQSLLPGTTPSAMAVWNQHGPQILDATRVPNDKKWQFHDFTAQLLQIISPRLPRSVKTVPYDWRPVEQAMTVAWERYQYLQLPLSERRKVTNPPRPLKVLVMGGSLLVGTNCRALMKELNFQFQLPKRECTWSNRLGWFLNALFHADAKTEPLVDVTKVAMGGTNTATGSVIWQYDLVPPDARNPDIVLNAYSTNDMHILTILEAQSTNTTLRDRTFEMMQTFVRNILNTRHCPEHANTDYFGESDEPIPPLLLHMDDYLGNEQRKIWETTELSQGVQVLANYYGFVSMSYADVIRDFVYGDTHETWFSSEWWKETKRVVTFEREIHPGMGMHISSTWVTAYNLLHLASTFCSMPNPYRPFRIDEYEPGFLGLPQLKHEYKEPKGKPNHPPKSLPPELTKDLLLEDVTKLWKGDANEDGRPLSCNSSESHPDAGDSTSKTLKIKCPFSWVSGLSLQQNNQTWVQEYFQQRSSVWNGWMLSDEGDKIGFVPTSAASGASNSTRMVLDFEYPQRIRSVTFFFMKSYGPKWEGSQVETKALSIDGKVLGERRLVGEHDKKTSEMYTEEITLVEPVTAGDKLQLEATHVGGQTFKLMGLAVCS
jgi:hypothetical protein